MKFLFNRKKASPYLKSASGEAIDQLNQSLIKLT